MNKYIVYSCCFLLGAFIISCNIERGELIDASKSENYYYSKDKKFAIYDNGKIMGWLKEYSEFTCDIATLEILNTYYAKDKDFVYYKGNAIKNVDVKSFFLYNGTQPRDKNYVYKGFNKSDSFNHIEYANPKYYRELSDGWYMDDKNYFKYNELVEDVDYETFEVISPRFAKDKSFLIVDDQGIIVKYTANTAKLRMIKKNKVITDGEQVFAVEKDPSGKMLQFQFNVYPIEEYRAKHPNAMKRFESLGKDSASF